MTAQQPTAPWTPNMNLLKVAQDWVSPVVTLGAFQNAHGDEFGAFHDVALAFIDATAEIERQRARADGLLLDYRSVSAEAGACRAEVERLKAELAALSLAAGMASKQQQQQPKPVAVPSDEEMDRALVRCMDDDQCSPDTYAMLILLTRRVGVRL